MGEYKGRINLSKEEMLFIINGVFEADVKETITKEDILKNVIPFYCKENYEKIIKMLSYEAYETLEKLVKYANDGNNDIHKFFLDNDYRGCRGLEEALIIVLRAKYGEYNYNINGTVLNNIKEIFSEKNKNLAKRYGVMEKLIKGLLYTYGVMNIEFFRKELSRHMKEIISYEEIFDFIYYRLNLNKMVGTRTIHWDNLDEEDTLITYLEYELEDFERIVSIFAEQKARGWDYKLFSKKELTGRNEYLLSESGKKLAELIRKKDRNFYDFTMEKYSKDVELGDNVLEELVYRCRFESEDDVAEFMDLFMQWYNNIPQYELCGYAPAELAQRIREI